MDIKGQGHLSCLDSNHTHFLLVDDGTQGQYGVEIELRTCLEKCISGKSLGHKGGKTAKINLIRVTATDLRYLSAFSTLISIDLSDLQGAV